MADIVVGLDRRASSRAALAFAAQLADRLDARLHVVHVVDDADMAVDPDSADAEDTAAGPVRADAVAALADFDGRWDFHRRHGDPAAVIAQVADEMDAEMIVLGAPRRGPAAIVERLLGESVAAAEIHAASRPVVLVPEHARERT